MGLACSVGFSTAPDLDRAIEEACNAGILGADLACLFVSSLYGPGLERAATEVQRRLGPRALLGCTVQGVIAGAREVEEGPCLTLWSATLPGAEVETFHATAQPIDEEFCFAGIPETRGGDTVLLLPDPFSIPLVEMLDQFRPSAAVLGGVASGGTESEQNRLFIDAETHASGAVGVRLRGVEIRPVVSQGCRPIGRPFVVTRAENNVLLGLAGKPPIDRLHEVFAGLNASDRALARQGLHVGCAIDEYKERHDTGDFLVRDVMGVEPGSGALTVTDRFRVGQTVQFHVRDAQSARDELARLLRLAVAGSRPRGALLFACSGRGTHMYAEPNVDAVTAREVLGATPVAGFFAGGEIGPVAGANFLHGFTASIAVFCERDG